MNTFLLGLILGSVLTGTLVGAGTFYDAAGKPNAPYGSVQQYDYYRQRQQFLDLNALRRNADNDRANRPCAR